ncbi:DMT family transporter [Pelagibacterium montanilacus]|uniref:DMT family transporter n=1 Tax=Pelagibacterium montanilacus TaxID=2185280 RepID=UPI000F8F17CC|nr:DMT family transporter [Pelagibacterium montanilacus]
MSSQASASPARINTPERGIVIMVIAMMLVPLGDTLSKLLTEILAAPEIAFWRFSFQALILAAVIVAFRQKIGGGPVGWLILGGLMSAATLVTLIGAFAVMPIATAIAIFFVEPLLLIVLSALILREKVGWRRYVAVLVGLVGALIVIRPSWDAFGWRTLLPVAAALAFALSAISMRKASETLSSVAIQFWFAIVACIGLGAGLTVTGGFTLVGASGLDTGGPWGMLVLMGLLSGGTFFLISEAFRRAPASTIAPFQYIEIVGATALGFIVFGDFPDFWTWVGTAIILGSGLYVFHRERRARRSTTVTAHSA